VISLALASAAIAALSAFAQASPAPLPSPGTQIERTVDPRPNVRAGRVEALAIASRAYRRERRLWVYTPPGYSPAAATGYDLLVGFDGGEYIDDIPLPMILDALLADGKAPPFVAVLIDNGTSTARLDDLANRADFAAFLADEVIPWVRQHWKVTRDPRRTIVTGSSAGGLGAAYVAFQRPDLFGNVLSQSGAFWRGNEASNEPPYEWLTSQIAASPRKDIRFLLEVGSRESRGALGGAAPSILEANRHLRDALRKKGYAVAYAEVPDGDHSPATWRQRLPAALASIAALQANR
jgi:enterochelin esterase family protein